VRLFKSRTLAAEAVAGGKVKVGGRRVKPAQPLRVGDRLTISRPGFEFECEVLRLPQRRGSAPLAQACYSETDAARAAREKYVEAAKLASAFAPRSLERPDKHGRRELRRLRGRD
jgi:ribosome-associated heat shock protein Hsp15